VSKFKLLNDVKNRYYYFLERKNSMKKKIISFIKKATKVADRTQEEILRDRKQKRSEMLDKLKREKNCKQ
jgi:hypothetical protein